MEHVESFDDPEAQAMAYDVLGKAYHRFGNDCSLVPTMTPTGTSLKVKNAPQFDRAAKFFRERLDGSRLLGETYGTLGSTYERMDEHSLDTLYVSVHLTRLN